MSASVVITITCDECGRGRRWEWLGAQPYKLADLYADLREDAGWLIAGSGRELRVRCEDHRGQKRCSARGVVDFGYGAGPSSISARCSKLADHAGAHRSGARLLVVEEAVA